MSCSCCCQLAQPTKDPISIKPVQYKEYDETKAKEYIERYPNVHEDLAIRCYTSNLIGAESSLVLWGGGNTSTKLKVKNKVGEEIDVLCIKGSGYDLKNIIPKGFPQVDLGHLHKMLKLDSLTDIEMVNELRTHMMDSSSPNPSVETLLHALIPSKFVDHSHADAIVCLADHSLEEAEKVFQEAFQGQLKFAIVPYYKPGFELAAAATKVFQQNQDIDCLILLKHGLFTFAETAKESYENHIKAVSLAENYIQSKSTPSLTLNPFIAPSESFFDKVTCTIRGVFEEISNSKWVVSYRESPIVAAFAQSKECESFLRGTITPDHVIRTKSKPCVIRGLKEDTFYSSPLQNAGVEETPEGDKKLREAIQAAVNKYVEDYHSYFNSFKSDDSMIELDPLPRVLLVENFGLLTVDRDAKACSISADIYEHTVPTLLSSVGTSPSGVFEPCSLQELFDVEYWELEQAKLKLGKKPGQLQGTVVFVTGGGSGIGLETACLFACHGACVYIADIDQGRVDSGIEKIVSQCKNKYAVKGGVVNVADRLAVEKAMHEVCMAFGGIDIIISNAGIVVQAAPGIASVAPSELEKSMKVNFEGHQWVSSAAVRRMVVQKTGGCLLYNVSKAPLNPGPKLGPYCIAKAATLALMRQYSVEYANEKIRSNCVNADRVRTNLFDIELVEKRAAARGLTAAEYFRSNALGEEVLSGDVAQAFLNLALAKKTTGAIMTVDGGNISAAPR